MSELDAAWGDVHDALPAGWVVNRPSWPIEDDRWHVLRTIGRDGSRPDYIESVGMDEALRGLAGLLRVWSLGHVEEEPQ